MAHEQAETTEPFLNSVPDLDPEILLELARQVPAWAGWGAVVLGIGCAFFGADRRLLRWTVGLLAGLAGWLGVRAILPAGTLGLSDPLLRWAAALALGSLGIAWPVAAAFTIGALVGGPLLAGWMPFDDPALRLLPGGAAVGILAALFLRVFASLATAGFGGALAAVGAAAILLGGGEARWLEGHPVAILLPFSLVFVSGAAFQLTRPPGHREPAARRAGRREVASAEESG